MEIKNKKENEDEKRHENNLHERDSKGIEE